MFTQRPCASLGVLLLNEIKALQFMKFTESSFSAGMRLGPAASHWPWLNVHAAERMVHSLGRLSAHKHGRNPLPGAATAKWLRICVTRPTNVGLPPPPSPGYVTATLTQGYFLSAECFSTEKKGTLSKTMSVIIELGHMSVHEADWWFPLWWLIWSETIHSFYSNKQTGFPESYEDISHLLP